MEFSFNAADHAQQSLTPGDYKVAIVAVDTVYSKAGDECFSVKYQVVDEGPFQGRNLSEWLNVNHSNEKAKAIAYETLSRICYACGLDGITNTDQLINHVIKVTVALDDNGYARIKKYHSKTLQSTAPQTGASTAQTGW